MRVLKLSDYRRIKDNSKTDNNNKDSVESDIRIDRIKNSIDRINQLMNNLRDKY